MSPTRTRETTSEDAVAPDLTPEERTVGRYTIIREVGRGGMAVVYLARQDVLNRTVALKELRPVRGGDSALLARFLRESRVSGSFTHPNVVTVFDYFEHDGTPYIAMEYLERGSLRPLVGRLSLAQSVGVLENVLAGLTEAETQRVVHRDLKPENLLITSEGQVKIADFGIAKALEQPGLGASLTETGMIVGTPSYMAPEQATAEGIDARTDLYATGVIAYELLVGRLPFGPPDPPMAILFKHVQEPIPPPQSLRRDLDPRIVEWLMRMLEKDRAGRPPSAHEAWEELEDIAVHVLGPRWRRNARLIDPKGARSSRSPPASAASGRSNGAGAHESSVAPTVASEQPEAATIPPDPRWAEPTVASQPSRQRPLRRVLLAAVVALAGASAAATVFVLPRLATPAPVTLPGLTGLRESEAVARIHALGLRVDARHVRRLPALRARRGVVFRQVPRRGAWLRSGAFVTLLVSTGKPAVTVPDVRNRRLRRARSTLVAGHLRVTSVAVHASRPIGTVLTQSPRAGRRVAWGSTVELRVSKGPRRIRVPSVSGLSYGAAAARLTAAGLRVVRADVWSEVPFGVAAGQRPVAGRKVLRGRMVTVYVSRGPEPTPPSEGGNGQGETDPTPRDDRDPTRDDVPDIH